MKIFRPYSSTSQKTTSFTTILRTPTTLLSIRTALTWDYRTVTSLQTGQQRLLHQWRASINFVQLSTFTLPEAKVRS